MQFVDTHAHSYVEEFQNERALLKTQAEKSFVRKVLLPNIDAASAPDLIHLVEQFPDFYIPMMGLHPCSVDAEYQNQLDELERYFLRHNIRIVGEIGLDYYWSKEFIAEQKDAFVQQIKWGKEKNYPIAVHCRNAFDDILDILEKEQNGDLNGVLHCFSGNLEQANRLIDIGFKLGIGGVVTFKNSGLDKVVKEIDMKHLVLETDAPYLAPVPFRGKRNESAYIEIIANKVAEVKEIELTEVATITTTNAKQLFGFEM